MSLQGFFAYATERELIRKRKERGEPFPWTDDPVLRSYYFCNVFREDDRTTRWFASQVRQFLRDPYDAVMATIVFRWFNYIPTGEIIKPVLLTAPQDLEDIEAALRPLQQSGQQLYSGAYIIKSPNGVDKLTGLMRCMHEARDNLAAIVAVSRSLESAHEALRTVPFLGPFMAYEVVTDLRHTPLLREAPDVNLWASAGPGAARGLQWVYGHEAPLSYTSSHGQQEMLVLMRELLAASRNPVFWPWYNERMWEMREVEHTLCEFDKYRRAQGGERMKRKYAGPNHS